MKPDFPHTSAQVRNDFPSVSKDLLDRLMEIFPGTLPLDPNYTDRAIAIAVGTQQVIGRLQDEYLRQNKLGPYYHVPAPR